MAWFNEQNTPDLPTDDRSFIIATSNLLQRFDYDLPPLIVRKMLVEGEPTVDWWSIPRVYKDFAMHEFAEGESWPVTNNAIVKQRRMDEKQAGFVDHYSLVADQRAHSIIDSLDGTIKNASEYGSILSWASYNYTGEGLDTNPNAAIEPEDDNMHVLQEGENIWDVGRKYNIPVDALIAENEIDDPRHIPVGTELYLPVRLLNRKDDKTIHYELLNPTRQMHVSRTGGAKKWSFGGVEKWEDLYSTGRLYPDGHNLDIVAIAHVPIGEDTAAYYMDAVSFGNYDTTGIVRYTNGFNWQHLAEGHTKDGTPAVPEVIVEQVVADAMQEENRVALLPEQQLTIVAAADNYKETFTFLNDDHTAEVYLFNEAMLITEMDNRLPAKSVGRYDGVRIIGTFTKDGILYGRPAMQKYWYGVPMDNLTLEDAVYNTDVDLSTRVAMRGHLTRSERRLVALAKTVSNYNNFMSLFKK